jgi:hypothetical protein
MATLNWSGSILTPDTLWWTQVLMSISHVRIGSKQRNCALPNAQQFCCSFFVGDVFARRSRKRSKMPTIFCEERRQNFYFRLPPRKGSSDLCFLLSSRLRHDADVLCERYGFRMSIYDQNFVPPPRKKSNEHTHSTTTLHIY